MALGRDGGVVRQLRTLFSVGTIGELTDGQLLERFAASRGEAAELAFAVLLERHGPMVLRVCRGVLRADSQDTQDAFHLPQRVGQEGLRPLVRDSLGPWLHQVVTARRQRLRRLQPACRRRRTTSGSGAGDQGIFEPDDELGQVLHEEIEGLPGARAPLVLVRSRAARCTSWQARNLGWPVGTVKSRHSRGRQYKDRPIRRGLAPEFQADRWCTDPAVPMGFHPALVYLARPAIQLATVRTFVAGSAASLAQGVLPIHDHDPLFKAASVLLVLGEVCRRLSV